jgi:hypothetical protein
LTSDLFAFIKINEVSMSKKRCLTLSIFLSVFLTSPNFADDVVRTGSDGTVWRKLFDGYYYTYNNGQCGRWNPYNTTPDWYALSNQLLTSGPKLAESIPTESLPQTEEFAKFLKWYGSGTKPSLDLFSMSGVFVEGRKGFSTKLHSERQADLPIYVYNTPDAHVFMPMLDIYIGSWSHRPNLSPKEKLAFTAACLEPAYRLDLTLPQEIAVRQKVTSYWRAYGLSDKELHGGEDVFFRKTTSNDGEAWLLYVSVCRNPEGCREEDDPFVHFGDIGHYGYFKISSLSLSVVNPSDASDPSYSHCSDGEWVPRQRIVGEKMKAINEWPLQACRIQWERDRAEAMRAYVFPH